MYLLKRSAYFFVILSVIAGCSSSKKTVGDKETPKEKVPDVVKEEPAKLPMFSYVENWLYRYNNGVEENEGRKISTIKYDREKNMVETEVYDQEGVLTERYTYAYDNKGNRVETIKYSPEGRVESRFSYEYDDKGRKTRTMEYKANGTLLKKYVYKYDDDDNLTEEIWYTPKDKVEQRFVYSYKNGKKTEGYNYSGKGELYYKYAYTYDDDGNLEEEIRYDKNGNPVAAVKSVEKGQ